jgi:hypothetical protein
MYFKCIVLINYTIENECNIHYFSHYFDLLKLYESLPECQPHHPSSSESRMILITLIPLIFMHVKPKSVLSFHLSNP